VAHTQNPSLHAPVGPHCAPVTHVPHVPVTQAIPPPHWLFAVHAKQPPSTQASPDGATRGPSYGNWLQSAKLVQDPHVSLMHVCPSGQARQGGALEHPPETQVSPGAQSASAEQVHQYPVWVAAQVAPGPHWLSEVQATQALPTHTSPEGH
jgi:hypothetical protein